MARLLVVGARLSPATLDGGGASAAALALAGNHKGVLRLLQKSCPGVSLGVSKKYRGREIGATGGDIGSARRRREQRPREVVDIDDEGRSSRGGGRGGGKGADEAGYRLLKAARAGDTIAMGEVLAKGEINVEWVGRSNGWTAVMEAAEHGSLEGVCYLVDIG